MTIAAARPPRLSIVEIVGSTDHKRIARRMIFSALAFFLAGGVMALLMRTELAEPGLQVVSTSAYNALFTMHGSTMIYLFMTPIALALGVYLVPLQVGAGNIAAPRIVLAGFVLYIAGGVAMYLGFLTTGGPGRATWIGVDPLSNTINTPGVGMDLWVIGVAVVTLGELLIGACVLATALRRRTPDMTLKRMAVFTWTMVATCLMVCFAFPVLVVAMALLWVERQYGGVFSASPEGPVVYQQLFWFYGHPVVYVMFFPFLGAVAEVFATFSGRRFFGYSLFIFSILAFAALSTSVWAHHMFTTGRVTNRYFALTSTLIAIPAGIEYFDLLGTLWRGRIRVTVPFLFAAGFFVQFLVGGLTGIWVASPPLDYHANNSYFLVAHFHYTLFAGSAFGLFAALYFWWPKFTGVMLRDRLGQIHFWLLVVGTNATFFPMFLLGQDGMTRRIADYPSSEGWGALNLVSTIGAFVIALAVLVFVVNVVVSTRARRPAGPDPWDGQTLEWATTSPPPPHNFDALPPVRSYAPLLDLKHEAPS
ncbi:cytochrome c oxidase subunit I [Capillimicrobium parvum]|uniref:Cytochrome c oxidase subunit 1 n=1 Tax=Capillimicrobium parvum TaxID=2884022 RepID=A0A9E7C3D8_9ACTN|nr:cbb3-type cytochrome c oxidase subunit I [Capillimicrobium parvum]UGS38368.1 putative cytochrome c oxidase subunit 1 [Capillimicrobium parvum]